MAELHPGEIELLEYVEGELDVGARAEVHAHVEACPSCAARVAELERARDVLRSSPLLGLTERRRAEILAALPRQERDRPAVVEFLASPKRLAAVLVPVAAVVVAVVALTTTGGNGEQRAAPPEAGKATDVAAAEAEAAPPPAEPAPEGPAATEAPMLEAALPPVASVAGPAADVGELLEQEGFSFTIVGPERIEVTGAAENDVRRALEDLPKGPVQVFVLPG
jgi:anti-sigma factor RsiW